MMFNSTGSTFKICHIHLKNATLPSITLGESMYPKMVKFAQPHLPWVQVANVFRMQKADICRYDQNLSVIQTNRFGATVPN